MKLVAALWREWLRTGATAVLTLLLSRLWLRWKERQRRLEDSLKWECHEDLGNVQACLLTAVNLRDCGRIEKRTIMTKRFEDVFPNVHVREMLLEASEKTTHENPFVMSHVPMQDRWHVLNDALNHLSSVFGPYHLFANSVACYESHWYLFTLLGIHNSGSGRFFITPHRKVRTRSDVGAIRIRLVLVDEQEIRKMCSGDVAPSQDFFAERHKERWTVMKRFADMFEKQLSREQSTFHGQMVARRLSSSLKRRSNSKVMENMRDASDSNDEDDTECNNFQRIHIPIPLVSYTTQKAPQDVVLYE